MNYLKKHKKQVLLVAGFIAVLLIGLVGVFAFTDFKQSLPIPIAKINGDYITYDDYIVEKTGYEYFLKNSQNQELDEETVEKDVISRLTFNKIMEDILLEYEPEGLTQSEIDETYAGALQGRTEKEFEDLIMTSYGWSVDQFKERVVVPTLTQQKMVEHFKTDPKLIEQYSTDALEFNASHIFLNLGKDDAEKKESKKVLNEILVKIKAGESFEDFASSINQDLTVNTQGDIGWFAQAAVAKEFGDVVAALAVDEISSEVVESALGLHIIKKTGERNVVDIDTYMNKRIEEADVDTFWGYINPIKAVKEEKAAMDAAAAELESANEAVSEEGEEEEIEVEETTEAKE